MSICMEGRLILACVQTSAISFVARGKEIGDVCTQARLILPSLNYVSKTANSAVVRFELIKS